MSQVVLLSATYSTRQLRYLPYRLMCGNHALALAGIAVLSGYLLASCLDLELLWRGRKRATFQFLHLPWLLRRCMRSKDDKS